MTTDSEIETEIKARGLTAPRVTPADIENAIAYDYCTTADQLFRNLPGDRGPLKLLTICVLVLRNGFTVVGTSACASPENFNAELGARIARQHAVDQMWPLLGYALRDKLAVQP